MKNKKNIIYMGLVSLFTDLSSEMVFPILPIFFQSVLGLNQAIIGIIEGAAETTASIFKLFSGYISDKIKKRKALVFLGYSFSAFLKPLFAFVSSWGAAFLIRVMERAGKGIRGAPRDALLAASAEKGKKGAVFGLHRAMDSVGAVFGVLILSVILHFYPYAFKKIFLISLIPGVIAIFFILKIKEKISKKEKQTISQISIKKGLIKSLPVSFKLFLIPTIIFELGHLTYAFFILRAQDIGVTIAMIPIVYLVYNIFYSSLSYPAGKISDKIGKLPTLIFGIFFFISATVLFSFDFKVWAAWIGFILYGIFFAFTDGVSKAHISEIVTDEKRATAIGVHNFILGVSNLPANAVVGFLWYKWNPKTAFLYCAVLAVVAAIGYTIIIINGKIKEKRSI